MSTSDSSFFGHPRGLATLFFTEMWERFSYYGTRALLILFMTADVSKGGLGFDVPKAAAIYGLYTALVYMLGLPGGWIADRFMGQRGAVLWGGILIALGNASLAVPSVSFFYLGLALVVFGTGLLKPNVSTIVGQIYAPEDKRRDAGFSIFYMGINLGAFLSPLICGYLAEKINWRMGFGVASIGMVAGLIQYSMGGRHLGEAGMNPVKPESEAAAAEQRRQLQIGLGTLAGAVVVVVALGFAGVITAALLSRAFGVVLTLTVIASFLWLVVFTEWTAAERKRLIAIFSLSLASAVFWSVFEQAGSTLNLFADRNTENVFLGFGFPASWFQSLNSVFLIALAPVFAWFWIKLGKNDWSSPTKFSVGLLFVGLGFAVLVPAASLSSAGKVSPGWLTLTYFLHTIGELCLSPVGLSAMTKLAPARIAGLTMGIWFLSIAVGNYLGGVMSGMYESLALPTLFGAVGAYAVVAAVIVALFIPSIKRMIGEVG